MKKDTLTAMMNTFGSTQDEKTRTLLENIMKTVNAEASQKATASMDNALQSFSQAKAAHTESMLKLNDIGAAITRSEKERQSALDESAEAEQNWRTRFRQLRGVMTPELKAEHSQRVAGRELAEEFTALIGELETDKTSAMLDACRSGKEYVIAHQAAFSVCANNAWSAVMENISPALVRAFSLRLRELEMKGDDNASSTLIQELGAHLLTQSRFYSFNMEQEPVISQLGLHRPALTGVDMELYKSPARRMKLGKELAEKKQAQGNKK
ncbi:capsid protein [Escherichia coli]|uniref:capsid protein n=1 Tax=Escherichia coli TaxID=562 RepID=UPI000DD51A87|nr:capsid protein [Escherichia coli]